METKVCCRCGVEKPISEYRHYYGGKKGYYGYCKQCERLETRRRYLVGMTELSVDQRAELEAINKLYELRAARGLKVPKQRQPAQLVKDIVATELSQYSKEDPVN